MIIPPVDKTRKQAIELSMGQVHPNASFAERVAQFDNMEALAKKREYHDSGVTTAHYFHFKLLCI
jgi:hypothetical protein